jgi:hypothetical protein
MSEERIAALLRSEWWLLPEAEVRRLIPTLLSERIEDLPGAMS